MCMFGCQKFRLPLVRLGQLLRIPGGDGPSASSERGRSCATLRPSDCGSIVCAGRSCHCCQSGQLLLVQMQVGHLVGCRDTRHSVRAVARGSYVGGPRIPVSKGGSHAFDCQTEVPIARPPCSRLTISPDRSQRNPSTSRLPGSCLPHVHRQMCYTVCFVSI